MTRTSFLLMTALVTSLSCLAACGDSEPQQKKKTEPFIITDEDTTPDTPVDVDETPDEPQGVSDAPEGRVYLTDPVKDERKTSIVVLPKPDNAEGALSNEAVRVFNCINEEGEPLRFSGFEIGYICKEEQTVRPQGGNYLHVDAPDDDTDPNDPFAEVQMYYHVNQIYTYLKDEQQVSGLVAIDALPNIQLFVNPQAAAATGQRSGWNPFDNAAYFFPESFAQLGLPARDEGAIVFGQGVRTDYSYDSAVIYHEYTHSMIGPNRLNGVFADIQGLNNTAGAINEGLADYFASSVLGDPVVGRYGLAGIDAQYVRDLSKVYTCPESLSTEVHDDGLIIGSYLYAVQQLVGKEATDRVVLSALNSAIQATGFDAFTMLLLNAAAQEDASVADAFTRLASERGLDGCERAIEWDTWQATRIPIAVAGANDLQGPTLASGAPGYLQHWLEAPADQAVTLSWTLQAGGGFGGPAQPSSLDLAIQHDGIVQLRGNGSPNAKYIVDQIPSQNGGQVQRQSITLAPSCLSQTGRTYLMSLNKGSGTNITSRAISYVPAADAQNAYECED